MILNIAFRTSNDCTEMLHLKQLLTRKKENQKLMLLCMGLIKIVGIHFAMQEAKDGHLQFFWRKNWLCQGRGLTSGKSFFKSLSSQCTSLKK